MYNIIITGGAGFIGKNLIKKLLKNKKNKIRIYDNFSNSSVENINNFFKKKIPENNSNIIWKNRIEYIKGDIRNIKKIINSSIKADLFFHLAADNGVVISSKYPRRSFNINCKGILNCLESCRINKIKNFFYSSSCAVVGDNSLPFKEDQLPKPKSLYACSKLVGEIYSQVYMKNYDIKTIIYRFGNVYGPYSENKNSIIAKFIKKILNRESLNIYGDGNQTRDFIYIEDLVNVISKTINKFDKKRNIINITNSYETTINDIVKHLKKIALKKKIIFPKVNHTHKNNSEIYRVLASNKKIKNLIKWSPKISLKLGLEKTFNYFLKIE